jgi:hypothetical protein
MRIRMEKKVTKGNMDHVIRGAFVMALTLLPVSNAQAQQALTVVWTGKAIQVLANGQITSWTVSMRIDTVGKATSIDYPSLNCGGVLTYLRTVDEIAEYRETLKYGTERCTNNGTVGFLQKLGKLIWYWSGEGTNNPTGVDVAVLSRNQ